MYAVIESGGKQYRIAVGDVIRVEKLKAAAGDAVDLNKVLLVCDDKDIRVGTPVLSGATVTARVKGHGRGNKVRVFKMHRRKNYRRMAGHRQAFTELEITQIAGQGGKARKEKDSTKTAPKAKPAESDSE